MAKQYFVFFKDLVTRTKDGIMRKEDKLKLDNIQEEANKTIVDSALNKTSQNPVENKVIATEIENLKKSGSDGKKNVAAAITGMGVPTAADADFNTITRNIEKIGGDTTISAGDVLSGKVAYAKGKYITGSMPNNGAKTAALDCGEYYIIPAGYHNGAGRVSANSLAAQTSATAAAADILSGKTAYVNGSKITGNIPSKMAATYTPGTTDKEIAAGQYLSGKQTVKGDANLAAANIKKGVSIFGVAGSFTEDATAGAGDILSGKTAYVNGAKVAGNIASKAAATYTPGTTDKEIAAGQYLSGKQTIKGDSNLIAANIKKGVSIFGVTGNMEADKTQVMLGNIFKKQFETMQHFERYLYDYKGSLSNGYYTYWYSANMFEIPDSTMYGGGSLIPSHAIDTGLSVTPRPLETYILFETGECLRLYLNKYYNASGALEYAQMFQWINNQEPTSFSIKVFYGTEESLSFSTRKDSDSSPGGSSTTMNAQIVVSKNIGFYVIPIAVGGESYAGPSYRGPLTLYF